jgi:hypothetical protein
MKVDFQKRGSKSAIGVAESLGGALGANVLQNATFVPEKAKKFMPYATLGLGFLGMLTDNEHLQNVGVGMATMSGINIVSTHIAPKMPQMAAALPQLVATDTGLGTVEGLGTITEEMQVLGIDQDGNHYDDYEVVQETETSNLSGFDTLV